MPKFEFCLPTVGKTVPKADEIVAAIDKAHASGATALNVMSSVLLWGTRDLGNEVT